MFETPFEEVLSQAGEQAQEKGSLAKVCQGDLPPRRRTARRSLTEGGMRRLKTFWVASLLRKIPSL